MEYRKLGKWGVKVSEVALGSWLTYGGQVDDEESIKQMEFAWAHGINFFDTADVYAGGHAEEVVGRAMRDLNRDDVFLATKCFFPMSEGVNDRGLSRKHVVQSCHASLKRLQTDYIDLYQCHRFDAATPLEELVVTMDILTRQGKILYWGVSEWNAEQIRSVCEIADALGAPRPVSNQPQYNMLQRQIEESVIPTSWELGLGQVVFSPLAQGVLTGKYKRGSAPPADSRAADERAGGFLRGRDTMSDANLHRVEQLEAIAKELQLSMAQLALAWILRLPQISSVIIGATKLSQIEDNIKASGVKLDQSVIDHIEKLLA